VEARAFCPGHVTCFFSVHTDDKLPPLKQGSRGAGFSIESGVEATLTTAGPKRGAGRTKKLPFALQVVDNGADVANPGTTKAALAELIAMAGPNAKVPSRLSIQNKYSLPAGAGFGVSGACALSATLAANEAIGLGLDWGDCVRAAHSGEVRALTGLGDVVGQASGGLEARVREGAPPHGEIHTFDAPWSDILLYSFGARPTRAFLSKKAGRDRLNKTGVSCLKRFMDAPSLETMLRLGRGFTETLGLASPAAARLMKELDPAGSATVAMLGDSVVFVPGPGGAGGASHPRLSSPFHEKTRVSAQGARLL
jgi:pantoate kinase